MKRGIVIQGGGAKFAFVAGELYYHIKDRGHDWDEYYGASAGALAALLASANDPELLKRAATTMSNKDLWSKKPTKNNGDINFRNVILRLLKKKPALGSTRKLRSKIEDFYTEDIYNDVKKQWKRVVACACNYTTGNVNYGSNEGLDYKTFLDFVWASTCVPGICEPVDICGVIFQDGGLLMNTPIQRAIDNGCDEIDVFLLTPKPSNDVEDWKGKTIIDYAGRSIEMMQGYISDKNLILSNIKANNKNVKIRFRYTPYRLCNNTMDAMDFNKERMTKWFWEGYEHASQRGLSDKEYL